MCGVLFALDEIVIGHPRPLISGVPGLLLLSVCGGANNVATPKRKMGGVKGQRDGNQSKELA